MLTQESVLERTSNLPEISWASTPGDTLPACNPGIDTHAFQIVYTTERHKVFQVCRRILWDPDEAEDACQEAFVKAWTYLGTFRGESTCITWICNIARNICLTRLRIRGNRNRYDLIRPREDSQIQGNEDRILARRDLERLMGRQNKRVRRILALMLEYGLNFSEVAHQLKVSRPAISRTLARVRVRESKDAPDHL